MLIAALPAVAAAVPDVDAPLRTGASAPGDAAVVIGVEDYAFLPDVPHAARDARAVYHALTYTRGLAPERVELVVGANREQILGAVKRAAASVDGGTLWVYFAGHGAASPDDGGLLLVGDDAKPDPAVFVARSLPLAEVLQVAGQHAAVVLDTCHAGRGPGASLVEGTRFAVPAHAAAPPRGASVWTAARPTQLSEAYDPAAHGLFTYFVVGALRGWADGELDGAPDGTVTLREAQAFVGRALATVHPSGQTPTFDGADATWVSASGLEPAPDLAALPKVGQPLVPLVHPAPAIGLSRPVPFTLPIELQPGGLLADAQGRTVDLQALMAATSGVAEADRAARRYQLAAAARTYGATMTLTGALVVGAAGYVALANADSGGVNVAGYLPYGSLAVIGTGLLGYGLVTAPKARAHYVEVANSTLEQR